MNAEQMMSVMRQVPFEAWPEHMTYCPPVRKLPGCWRILTTHLLDMHAELLFEAAMVRWLWSRWPNPAEFYLSPLTSHLNGTSTINGYQCEMMMPGGQTITVSGTTPLEVLAASCKKIGAAS